MNEVSSHTVNEITLRINYVLVIEEELIRLHKHLFLNYHFILWHLVPHDCVILQIVVRNGLASEQNQCFLVYHMESNKPDLFV